jgi:chloramphenicol-sensitive protein RarD
LTRRGAAATFVSLPPLPPAADARRGVLAAFGAFTFWGLVPAYWKLLDHVGAVELMAHRTVWSVLFLVAVLAWRRQLPLLRSAVATKHLLMLNVTSGTLLMLNWWLFLWAVNNGHVLAASLGYFLVPLFNVAAGCLFFHERPRRLQWLAVALAAAGVAFLLVGVGHVPWIALGIVATWGGYGLVRKRSPMGALDGLTVETLLYTPFAVAYLGWLASEGGGLLGRGTAVDHTLCVCSGWITAVPLVWFGFAAARIRLTTLGLMQYIAPSLQFLLGWLVYREDFDSGRLVAYVLIWCGLACYTADSFVASARRGRG